MMDITGTTMLLASTPCDSRTSGQGIVIHCLPVEVLELIFQALRDDRPTIVSCTRVSREWCCVVRPHAFASLTFRRKQEQFAAISDFLSSHPDISSHVLKLELVYLCGEVHQDQNLPRTRIPSPVVDRAVLAALMGELPRLSVLHIREILTSTPSDDDGRTTTPYYSPTTRTGGVQQPLFQLDELVLRFCQSAGRPTGRLLPALFDLLALFSSITTLKLYDMSFLDTHPLSSRRSMHPLVVRNFVGGGLAMVSASRPDYDDRVLNLLFDALRQTLLPQCIRELRTAEWGPWDLHRLRAFGAFVKDVARGAAHLNVPFAIEPLVGFGAEIPEHWRALNLLNLHILTCLTFLTVHLIFRPCDLRSASATTQPGGNLERDRGRASSRTRAP
ncbi:hypothetical protein C8Q77DRAFT_178959 [Trametes polyzona]|nr:hypothetical protein C8Q77DRAFT_178959 [Trametes polyzona]